MIRALLCKDLRLHALPTAGCWLALLGATWLAGSARFTYGVPLLVGVFAPTVIVAILGIVFFAGETDGGTEAFLHSLPVSRRAIWTARLVATLFHALLIACLSAWLIVRGMLSLPELAEVWKYNVQHWENLRFVLLCLPYAIVLCFTVSLSTGATSLSTRWGIIRYVVSLLLCIAVYVSLIAVSGTLGWDWRSGTGLDWLVASEVALAGVVACLAACRAFCSSAVGEPLNRLRRATITWVVATSVLALAILPFHCWANRTPPYTARVLWSPQLSPDGRFVVSEGMATKLGRVFGQRVFVADIHQPSIACLSAGMSARWLQHKPHTVQFELPRFISWPRYVRIARADAVPRQVHKVDIPALHRVAKISREGYAQPPALNPRTLDLLFAWDPEHRSGGSMPNRCKHLWVMSRDGRRLSKLLPVVSGATVARFCWDPEGAGAFAVVKQNREGTESQTGKLYWVSGDAHREAPPTLIAKEAPEMEFSHWDYSRWLSADSEWVAYEPTVYSTSKSPKRSVEVRQCRGSGRYTIPFPSGTQEVSTRWSPLEPVLSAVSTVPEEQVEVRICDPVKRRSDTVFRFSHPGHRVNAEVRDWSTDGRRLLVSVEAFRDQPPEREDAFKAFKRETPARWLFEIDVQTRKAVMLCGQEKRIYSIRPTDPEWKRVCDRYFPDLWPIGYDSDGKVLLLKKSRELLRLDPETGKMTVILKW